MIFRKLLLLIVAIGLGITNLSHGQNSNTDNAITVSEVNPIVRNPPFPLVETFLAVNPTDPDNILASAVSTSTDSSVVYATWDSGTTWQKVKNGNHGVFAGGDPMLAFDGNGRAYFTTITPTFTVWHSTDGGRTWSEPVYVDKGLNHDRQWIAAAQKSDRSPLPIYSAAKTTDTEKGQHVLVTNRSLNGAKSFSETTINSPKNQNINTPTDLVVRNNGTILLPYLVYHGYKSRSEGIAHGERLLLISDDQGETWSGPHHIGEKLVYGNAVQDQRLTSKGLEAPSLAVDETADKFDGSAYTAWTTIIDGHLQVVAAHSRDGGHTWSEPTRVNDGGFNSNHSTAMTAVNDDGVIAVTWNDRRNDSEDNCFQHYVAVSYDGGQTFSRNKKISNRKTCPSSERFINGGETQGLVALPDGTFRVTWPVGKADNLTMWTAVINVTPKNR